MSVDGCLDLATSSAPRPRERLQCGWEPLSKTHQFLEPRQYALYMIGAMTSEEGAERGQNPDNFNGRYEGLFVPDPPLTSQPKTHFGILLVSLPQIKRYPDGYTPDHGTPVTVKASSFEANGTVIKERTDIRERIYYNVTIKLDMPSPGHTLVMDGRKKSITANFRFGHRSLPVRQIQRLFEHSFEQTQPGYNKLSQRMQDILMARNNLESPLISRPGYAKFFPNSWLQTQNIAIKKMYRLNREQESAVRGTFSNAFMLINAGRGPGIVGTIKAVLYIAMQIRLQFIFTAGTNRALDVYERTIAKDRVIQNLLRSNPQSSQSRGVSDPTLDDDQAQEIFARHHPYPVRPPQRIGPFRLQTSTWIATVEDNSQSTEKQPLRLAATRLVSVKPDHYSDEEFHAALGRTISTQRNRPRNNSLESHLVERLRHFLSCFRSGHRLKPDVDVEDEPELLEEIFASRFVCDNAWGMDCTRRGLIARQLDRVTGMIFQNYAAASLGVFCTSAMSTSPLLAKCQPRIALVDDGSTLKEYEAALPLVRFSGSLLRSVVFGDSTQPTPFVTDEKGLFAPQAGYSLWERLRDSGVPSVGLTRQ